MTQDEIVRKALLARKQQLADDGFVSPAEQVDSLEQAREKTVCNCGHGCDYTRTTYEKANNLTCNNSRV